MQRFFFLNFVSSLVETDNRIKLPEIEHSTPSIHQSTFRLHPTTKEGITKYIDKLKNKSNINITHDTITSKTTKRCKDELVPAICDLVNMTFEQGKVASTLKIVRVVPVLKKGSKNDCSNYQPITILPSISKILDMAMRATINNYMDSIDFLSRQQYGFKKNTNTNYALLDIVVKIQDSLDNNILAAGLLIDMTKAFSTVNHHLLLQKLRKIRFTDRAWDRMKSY